MKLKVALAQARRWCPPLLAGLAALLFVAGLSLPATCQVPARLAEGVALAESLPEEKVPQPNREVDDYVKAEMTRQNLVGVALGVVQDGKILYLKGYGWGDREARVPVRSRQTMFRWASISKTLTAIAALHLVHEGKLDLDRPITDYLRDYQVPETYLRGCTAGVVQLKNKLIPCVDGFHEFPLEPSERVITMRMLLGHLGGIMHYQNGKGDPVPPASVTDDPKKNTGIAWALDYFGRRPLVAKPGTEYHYTTFGFNLAGAAVEKAGGKPYAQQVSERIAQRLGLKTLQPDYEWKAIAHRAVGYYRARESAPGDSRPAGNLAARPAVRILRQGSTDVSWKLPGGGFVSTIEDMALYCGGLMDDKLLAPEMKQQAWTTQKDAEGKETGYGLGFGVAARNGRRLVSHSGSQEKTRTRLNLYPDDRLCIVVMSNTIHADVGRIATGVEDIVRSQPATTVLK
ncbi:MAG: beta-lactamase family protein [Acidobacteria bacterium]|nr:beta-lactamase family protein [Acidobacteriota bacterium]